MAATQGGTLGGLMGSGMSGLAVATHVRNKALGPDVDPQIGVEQPLSPQAVTQASPTQNGVSALTKIVHSDMAPDGGQAAPVAGRGSTQSLPALFQPALQPRANPDTLSAADPDPVRPAQPVDKQPTGTMSNAGMVSTGNETPVMASPSKSGGISIDPRGIAPGQQTDLEAGRHEALYRDAQQRRRDGGLYVMQQLEARAANEQALATQQAKPAYQRARAMWLDAEAQLRLLDARKQAAAPPLKIDRQSDTGTANQIADLHEQRGSQTPPVANSPQQVPQLVQQRRMNHRVQSTPVQAARTMPQQSPIVLAAPVVGPLPRSQSQAELARTTPGAVTAVPAVAERQAPATQIAPDSQQPVSSGQGQPISRAPLAQAYAKAYKLAGTHEVMPAEGGGYVRWPRAGGTSGSMAAQARLAVPVAPPAQTAASYSTQAGRRSDAPTKGTRAPVIRVALQARISQWQNAPKINVVQSVAELPAH
ncbi:hypothetical protein, partial [Andreprevotia sp. IGB-42]|uniref:hypothetical protein n=1 Tax=Andreprevotia sp. IGB-42 TaxID=2497473 RepID=UPI00135A759F